jgi:hypothetical protein
VPAPDGAYGSRPPRRRLPPFSPLVPIAGWDRFTARPGRPVAPDRRTARRVKTAGSLSWPTVHRPSTPERVTTPEVGLSRGRNPDQAALESARSPGRWPDPGGGAGKCLTIDLRKSAYDPGGVTPPDYRGALLKAEWAAPGGGTAGATRTTQDGMPTPGRGSPAAGLPVPGVVGLGSARRQPILCGHVLVGRLPYQRNDGHTAPEERPRSFRGYIGLRLASGHRPQAATPTTGQPPVSVTGQPSGSAGGGTGGLQTLDVPPTQGSRSSSAALPRTNRRRCQVIAGVVAEDSTTSMGPKAARSRRRAAGWSSSTSGA